MTRLSSLVFFCDSNSNKPDLLVRNKFPDEFSRIYESLACVKKKTPLIFGSKVVKFHLTKASYHNYEDFISLVWWNDHFWWSGVFFTKFWNFYTKSNVFNIFMFYCWHPINHELSVFICVIVMDISQCFVF